MPVHDYQEEVPTSPKRKSETTNTTKKQKKRQRKLVDSGGLSHYLRNISKTKLLIQNQNDIGTEWKHTMN
jgi:hypothetical protein